MLKLKALILTLLLILSAPVRSLEIKIGVFSDQLSFISELFDDNQCPAIAPNLFGENQMIAEYLLICNILKAQHNSLSVELVPYPVSKRIVDAISRSEIDISGFGIWKNEANQSGVLLSAPLLRTGEFSKGLYTLPARAQQIDWFDSRLHPELTVVANMNWTNDWQALACTGMSRVHVGRYGQMFEMLARGRTDILPMAFGSDPQLIRKEFGIELHPIQGVKLIIDQSSHILVAKNTDNAESLLSDINQGLQRLRQKGAIAQTYVDVGVTNPIVSNWASLCDAPKQ